MACCVLPSDRLKQLQRLMFASCLGYTVHLKKCKADGTGGHEQARNLSKLAPIACACRVE